MAISFSPTVFVNGDSEEYIEGTSPCLSAEEMNKLGNGILLCVEAINAMLADPASDTYSKTFTTSDWTKSGSVYVMPVLATTHGKDYDFTISVYHLDSNDYYTTYGYIPSADWIAKVDSDRNVYLQTTAPFTGKIVLA